MKETVNSVLQRATGYRLTKETPAQRREALARAKRSAAGRQRNAQNPRKLPPPAVPTTPAQQRRQRLRGMSLTELAEEFGTDKWGGHWYTPHYERHLGHLKRERFTLLEIGIGGSVKPGKGGWSLRMWKWYFPKARIVGLDLYDKSFVDAPRIRTYQGSQDDPAVLRRILQEEGAPLVAIDDGSHRSEHVLETFRILFPLLPAGATYVIEDTQTSYWPRLGGDRDRESKTTTMGMVKQMVDGLNYEEFLDEDYEPTYSDTNVVAVHCYHNLVFIEKGSNMEGSNPAKKERLLPENQVTREPASAGDS